MKNKILLIIFFFACSTFLSVFCSAQTILSPENTLLEKAIPLSADELYENESYAGTTQYYCLYAREEASSAKITIKTTEIPSLSFQLFDQRGVICTPSSYQYQPSGQLLQIDYNFSAKEGYVLALTNLSEKASVYSITYQFLGMSSQKTEQTKQSEQAKQTNQANQANQTKQTEQTKKQNSNKQKNKKTSQPKKTSIQKTTTSSYKNNNSTAAKENSTSSTGKKVSSIKNKTTKKSITTSKPNKKKPQKLSLSKTFLQIPVGKTLSLKANITPKDASSSCQWFISNSRLLTTTSRKNISSGNILTIKAKKKGTAIVTCKAIGNKKLTASCTIKII